MKVGVALLSAALLLNTTARSFVLSPSTSSSSLSVRRSLLAHHSRKHHDDDDHHPQPVPSSSCRREEGHKVVRKQLWAWGRGLVSTALACGLMAAPSFGVDFDIIDKQTVTEQLQRLDKEEQAEYRSMALNPNSVIARGIIRLPSAPEFPVGPPSPSSVNYALENDNAAILIACYGREGGPIAAKRIPLRGLQFPYAFDINVENLMFPLTKATWEADPRSADDLGVSVLLDLDGKFATANENDLLGFGVSKPVNIAGSQIRRDALVVVSPRTGVKQYTDEEIRKLSDIDFELERQARGASLAQLAETSSNIEVKTSSSPNPLKSAPSP